VSATAAPVVLVGPSGAGKTTLAHRLVNGSPAYVFSVSATTRPPRPGERDGVDYHFVDRARFEEMVGRGKLAEWAEVHDRLYGTPRAELEGARARGEHVVLDIDVQGARQIRAAVPDSHLIFVLPPNVDIMMARLLGRGTESRAEVARRLGSAKIELAALPEFDHAVVNGALDECVEAIRGIVERGEASPVERHLVAARAYQGEIDGVLKREYGEFQ